MASRSALLRASRGQRPPIPRSVRCTVEGDIGMLRYILKRLLLMIPTVAFAESTHTLSKLDLTASGHSDKTLENDGYTWDAENAVLTLKDIRIGGDIILPKENCTINVQGECYAGRIWRNDSGATQSTTINGTEGAKLWAEIEVSGALTLNKLTMTDGIIRN